MGGSGLGRDSGLSTLTLALSLPGRGNKTASPLRGRGGLQRSASREKEEERDPAVEGFGAWRPVWGGVSDAGAEAVDSVSGYYGLGVCGVDGVGGWSSWGAAGAAWVLEVAATLSGPGSLKGRRPVVLGLR